MGGLSVYAPFIVPSGLGLEVRVGRELGLELGLGLGLGPRWKLGMQCILFEKGLKVRGVWIMILPAEAASKFVCCQRK